MAKFITGSDGTQINTAGLTPQQIARINRRVGMGGTGQHLAGVFQARNARKYAKGIQNPAAVGNIDLTGAPQVVGSEDLSADVDKARDAAYNYTTQYYAKDKAQELEDAKQELANRGIPMDPTEGSLWQKSLDAVERKYQNLYDQASNLSIAQGNTILSTEAGVSKDAFTSFLQGAMAMSDAELKRYGIDQDTINKLRTIKASKQIAGMEFSQPIVGGTAP